MRDPDQHGAFSEDDEDSSEVEDMVDFSEFAKSRILKLFRGRKNADPKDKSVSQLLKKNDLKLMKRLIEKVVEQNKRLDHLSIKEREYDTKMEYLHTKDK